MTNSNYNRGRAREYQVINTLRREGWMCSRSAMSHGPVDVFAARAGEILLIQVKSGSARIKKVEIENLRLFALAFKAKAQVWSFKKRGVLEKVTVSNGIRKKPRIPLKRIDLPENISSQQVAQIPIIALPHPSSQSS